MLRIGLCDDDKEYLQLLMHMVRLWADYSRVEAVSYTHLTLPTNSRV